MIFHTDMEKKSLLASTVLLTYISTGDANAISVFVNDQKGYLLCAVIPVLLLSKSPIQDNLKLGIL